MSFTRRLISGQAEVSQPLSLMSRTRSLIAEPPRLRSSCRIDAKSKSASAPFARPALQCRFTLLDCRALAEGELGTVDPVLALVANMFDGKFSFVRMLVTERDQGNPVTGEGKISWDSQFKKKNVAGERSIDRSSMCGMGDLSPVSVCLGTVSIRDCLCWW